MKQDFFIILMMSLFIMLLWTMTEMVKTLFNIVSQGIDMAILKMLQYIYSKQY